MHLAFLFSNKAQATIVSFFSQLAFLLIICIFLGNVFQITIFNDVNINDLFNFNVD